MTAQTRRPETKAAQPEAARCDELGFVARRFLRGGHLQTLASYFIVRGIRLPAPEDRQIEVAPGVNVLVRCHWQPGQNALTVVAVHGLEGSSESQYMLGLAQKGLAAGMNVVRMNQRACGGSQNTAPTLYHSGLSGDVAAVARHLIAHDGITRLALVGFSMGGNLVLKLAGEWGGNPAEAPPQFRAVAAVCPAMDLAASADALHLPSNRLYEEFFLWQLRRSYRAKVEHFPQTFDLSRMRGIRSLREFDDRITAYYCGFAGATDYYARAAATNVVERIAVPGYILHAANDPFVRILPETRARIQSNHNLIYYEPEDGGHCAFIGARDGVGYDGYWSERQIVEFLRKF